jgi:hypothetical protein
MTNIKRLKKIICVCVKNIISLFILSAIPNGNGCLNQKINYLLINEDNIQNNDMKYCDKNHLKGL